MDFLKLLLRVIFFPLKLILRFLWRIISDR